MERDYSRYNRVSNYEIEKAIAEYNRLDTKESYINLLYLFADWCALGGLLLVPVYSYLTKTTECDSDEESQEISYKVLPCIVDNNEKWLAAYTSVDEVNIELETELETTFFLMSITELGAMVLNDEDYGGLVINPDYNSIFLDKDFFIKHLVLVDQ